MGSQSELEQEEGSQASGMGKMLDPVSDVLHLCLRSLTMKLCPEPLLCPRIMQFLSNVHIDIEELCITC